LVVQHRFSPIYSRRQPKPDRKSRPPQSALKSIEKPLAYSTILWDIGTDVGGFAFQQARLLLTRPQNRIKKDSRENAQEAQKKLTVWGVDREPILILHPGNPDHPGILKFFLRSLGFFAATPSGPSVAHAENRSVTPLLLRWTMNRR
jgi:hypothetical protein